MTSLSPVAASDLFRRAPDRYLDVGAGEVALRSVGQGPDLLFVHGFPVSGATFRLLLPALSEHFTCHVIDLPGAGDSHYTHDTEITVDRHIASVRRVVDLLGLDDLRVIGHDSGGLIARHALAGDPRVRAWGLLNTEPASGVSWRFKAFLLPRRLPGFGRALGWLAGQPTLRRNGFVFGDAFADRSLLDGEFDEFFLRPLHTSPPRQQAAIKLLRSFDLGLVTSLAAVHRRIEVPVQLVWGDQDPFFPLPHAEEMVATFLDARLAVIDGAGLFSHEERPSDVADALLPLLATAV